MNNKDRNNYPKYPFIIIYYDVMRDLNIDFESYILLHYLFKISKKNIIGKINMSKIEEKLFAIITRKTLDRKLKKLIKQEHIIEDEKGIYRLNADIESKLTPSGYFLIVYFEMLLILKIRVKKYLLLYLAYSLFRMKNNQNGFFNENMFCECLNIRRTMYFRHRKDLVDRGYIIEQNGTQYQLAPNLYKEFEKLKRCYGN